MKQQITVEWKAYPMDRRGIKTCQRGEVRIHSPETQINGSRLKEVVRLQVLREHPELTCCAIHLSRFSLEEQEGV